MKYVETSAKSGENVEKMFETLVRSILEGGGGNQDANGGGATGDIIRVRASVTQKGENVKKKKCCSRN